MNYILFDDESRYRLLPFTHTRPVADIRCGILTMRERWEYLLNKPSSTLTENYLQAVFPLHQEQDNIFINGAIFGNPELVTAIQNLQTGEKLVSNSTTIAVRLSAKASFETFNGTISTLTEIQFPAAIQLLKNVWDIFSLNDQAIRHDFTLLTAGKKSAAIPDHVTATGTEQLFIEEGAVINAGCIINAQTGPIYIGKHAEILEGVMIRGPLALNDHAVIKMGAKIYGATTIGPGCKVGGEISNVVFLANSNKGHDGYLGNAAIGEWCNLGADTNCSNLKNNYDAVKIWDEHANKSIQTGLIFCGLIMGDHSKCGINTMFNTGTVAGVSCNIYGGGFPEKFIPSFCWGGSEGMVTYSFDRAMDTAARMMARRNRELSDAEKEMYRYLFTKTEKQRELFANNSL